MNPNARAIFERYLQQLRTTAIRGYHGESLTGFMRFTSTVPGVEGFIVGTDLDEADLAGAIATQTDHFEALGHDFEWKVYDFDRPARLPDELRRHGFTAGDAEAFMVYPLEQHRSRPLRDRVRIEQVTTADDIQTIVRLQSEVWRENLSWLEQSLAENVGERYLLLAYVDDTPVGTGWVNLDAACEFADLHGGAVLPEFRGRGVYSALFDARADEARRRGYRYLTVDAAPMSRPILLRQGFEYVCETTPFRWKSNRKA